MFAWREEDPSTRKILEGGRTFRLLKTFGRSGYQVEKEKKKTCRPIAAERLAAAMFVLFVPSTSDLPSESSFHGARISQLGRFYLYEDPSAKAKFNFLHVN